MYHSHIAEPIQANKCFSCKFEGHDSERNEDVCCIKGCYQGSKYVPFNFDKWIESLSEKSIIQTN